MGGWRLRQGRKEAQSGGKQKRGGGGTENQVRVKMPMMSAQWLTVGEDMN